MAKSPAKAAPVAVAAPASAPKSIVNPKYRDKYKGAEKDWLAKFLDGEATLTRDVKVTKPNPDNADEKITVTEKRPDGVDIDALFTLASKNGLDVAKYSAQRDSNGFAGRFRMTIRNMLQKVVKQRHGLFNVGGTFTSAPAEFLTKIGAPEAPTHTQAGEKIAKPAAPTEPAADTPAGEKAKASGPAAKK